MPADRWPANGTLIPAFHVEPPLPIDPDHRSKKPMVWIPRADRRLHSLRLMRSWQNAPCIVGDRWSLGLDRSSLETVSSSQLSLPRDRSMSCGAAIGVALAL